MKDFLSLKEEHEDQWKCLVEKSMEIAGETMKIYLDRLVKTEQLKNQSQVNNDIDIQNMCGKLMREVFWQKPPEAIEMYAIKKHM